MEIINVKRPPDEIETFDNVVKLIPLFFLSLFIHRGLQPQQHRKEPPLSQPQRRIRSNLFVKIDESCNSILDDDISYDKTEDDVEMRLKIIEKEEQVGGWTF